MTNTENTTDLTKMSLPNLLSQWADDNDTVREATQAERYEVAEAHSELCSMIVGEIRRRINAGFDSSFVTADESAWADL